MQNKEKMQKNAEKVPYEAPKASFVLVDGENVLYASLPIVSTDITKMFRF